MTKKEEFKKQINAIRAKHQTQINAIVQKKKLRNKMKKAKIKSASTPRAKISAVINVIVGLGTLIGVSSNTTNPTDVPWWSWPLVLVIALLLGNVANLGTAIFKLVTPQQDYIVKTRLNLLLIEWAIIFGLPVAITFYIAFFMAMTT